MEINEQFWQADVSDELMLWAVLEILVLKRYVLFLLEINC